MSEPIPACLARVGITSLSDNIPEGYSVAFSSDFVRMFRAEIELKLYGWKKTAPAIKRVMPEAER